MAEAIKEELTVAVPVTLQAIPDEAWVMMNLGDQKFTQNMVDQSRMMNVLQYFMDNEPTKDAVSAMNKLRNMMDTFGSPPIGLNRLDQMFKYVTIQRHINMSKKK